MVKVEINLTNKWLYSLIVVGIVFVLGIGVYAYGGSNPAVHGHNAGEINGSLGGSVGFGEWQETDVDQIGGDGSDFVRNEVYQAATDGFVTFFKSGCTGQTARAYTHSNRSKVEEGDDEAFKINDGAYGCGGSGVTLPVRKNDYWKVYGSGGGNIWWISLG